VYKNPEPISVFDCVSCEDWEPYSEGFSDVKVFFIPVGIGYLYSINERFTFYPAIGLKNGLIYQRVTDRAKGNSISEYYSGLDLIISSNYSLSNKIGLGFLLNFTTQINNSVNGYYSFGLGVALNYSLSNSVLNNK